MLKAAIYARYSSERQKATSIEDQVALCRDAAARFDCLVSEVHTYTDKEISGTTELRPGYTRLMKAAKARQFEAVLVESQDRLWRDQGEMHSALKRLKFWGIKVFSVSASTDLTDKTGKLMASVMGWKDEAFIEDLKEKTRRGMQGQIRRGLSAGGRAYGYRSEPVRDHSGQITGFKRVIDLAEAKVVRRIFKLYAGGMGPKVIARSLNAEHVPPPRTPRGRKPLGWTWTTISGASNRTLGILHNPLYIGQIIWNRTQKVRDPDTGRRTMRVRPRGEWISTEVSDVRIISNDLWEAVQKRSETQRRAARGNLTGRRPKYLWSGLLKCAECGSNYVVKSGAYYGCAGNINRGPEICANTKQVRRDRLEEVLLKTIFDEVFSPETVAYITRKVNESLVRMAASPDAARKRKEADLARARQRLEHIKEAIAQGMLTPTTKTMLEEAERDIAELEAALQAPPPKSKVTFLPSVVETYLKDLRGTLSRDTDKARSLLAKMVGQVTLRRSGDHLVAELRGNLNGLLDLDDCDNSGAGRGI